MDTIQIQDKSYEIKDTMLVREYRQVMSTLKIATDISNAIKDGKEEDLAKYVSRLNLITVEDWTYLEQIVKRCYGMTEEEIGDIHYADILFLFSELMNESRKIKKKLPMPSVLE